MIKYRSEEGEGSGCWQTSSYRVGLGLVDEVWGPAPRPPAQEVEVCWGQEAGRDPTPMRMLLGW